MTVWGEKKIKTTKFIKGYNLCLRTSSIEDIIGIHSRVRNIIINTKDMNFTIHKTGYEIVTVILNNNMKYTSFYSNNMKKQKQF